jgi:hypothetical protein
MTIAPERFYSSNQVGGLPLFMNVVYVLDACAMLAVLSKEAGADKAVEIYCE